jgi:2-hydroxychromene-2-carboxylate isomerase
MPVLEFWYDFASSYSYPAALRIERLAAASGFGVRWRAFLLGPIFKAQGWTDSPFNLFPAKGRYMWRDLARICAKEKLLLERPRIFPQNGLKAARVALFGDDAPWVAAFTRAVYTANFAEQKDIAEDATLASILEGVGVDAAETLRKAGETENKERLKARTDEAISRGIFGAPSFLVGEELFWGNDRLEEALAWAKEPLILP